MVDVVLPSAPPLQFTLVTVPTDVRKTTGWVIVTLAEPVQPLWSTTFKVYLPAVNPLAVGLFPPEGDHV